MATALHVSTYSYKSLAMAALPLMEPGGSVVGLTFDATKAWPVYDWMGVAKAGLESASRYLALHLGTQGIRVNLVAAGPLRTMAARSRSRASSSSRTPGPSGRRWAGTSPTRSPPQRPCLALLSDWFPATTGEIIHVDGGYHARFGAARARRRAAGPESPDAARQNDGCRTTRWCWSRSAARNGRKT